MKKGHRISGYQQMWLISAAGLSFGLFAFPRDLLDLAGRGAWYTMPLVLALALFGMWLLLSLARMFPDQTQGEYMRIVLGKPLGITLLAVLAIAHLYWQGILVRMFGDTLASVVLQDTPIEIIILSALLAGVLGAWYGIETLGRGIPLILIPSVIVIIASYLFTSNHVDVARLVPDHRVGFGAIGLGTLSVFYTFMGLEKTLFTFPFADQSAHGRRLLYGAVIFNWLLLCYLMFFVLGIMGPEAAEMTMWPSIFVLRLARISGWLIERLGISVVIVWSLLVFNTVAVVSWGWSMSWCYVFGFPDSNYRYFLLPSALTSYVFAKVPSNVYDLVRLHKSIVSGMALVLVIVVPAVLLVVARLRGFHKRKVVPDA